MLHIFDAAINKALKTKQEGSSYDLLLLIEDSLKNKGLALDKVAVRYFKTAYPDVYSWDLIC